MSISISKVTRQFRITLPKHFCEQAHISEGDFVSFKMLKDGNLSIMPLHCYNKQQAYFWTPKAQKEIALALDEIKRGKAKKFKSVKEARENLET